MVVRLSQASPPSAAIISSRRARPRCSEVWPGGVGGAALGMSAAWARASWGANTRAARTKLFMRDLFSQVCRLLAVGRWRRTEGCAGSSDWTICGMGTPPPVYTHDLMMLNDLRAPIYGEIYTCGCFESHPGPAEECFSTTLGGFGSFFNYMRGVKRLGLDTPLMTWDCHEWGTRAVEGLLPFPEFGDGGAGGVDFVLEGGAGVVETGELLRRGAEEEHAAVADGTAGQEFADAGSGPGDAFAVVGHVESLAFAEYGAVGADDRGVGAHAAGGNAEHVAGVFEGDFHGWGVDGGDPSYDSFAFGFAKLFSEHSDSFLVFGFGVGGLGRGRLYAHKPGRSGAGAGWKGCKMCGQHRSDRDGGSMATHAGLRS